VKASDRENTKTELLWLIFLVGSKLYVEFISRLYCILSILHILLYVEWCKSVKIWVLICEEYRLQILSQNFYCVEKASVLLIIEET
jgi:hypothetical protein